MIVSIKHKGLKELFINGNSRGDNPGHAAKLRMQLAALDTAIVIEDLDIPGYRLHRLSGDRRGTWSISVSGNWRLTFRFADGNVYLLNYGDSH
ncbi:MAG: type II toxin-antitoxin system RelE/ParE family toxin [Pseudohongiellaceae bacterium]